MLKKVYSPYMIKKLKLSTLAIVSIFAATLVFGVFGEGKVSAFSGSGAGTSGNPFQITTCIQLQEMQDDLGADYRIENNIDCSATSGWNAGAGFEPVGNDTTPFVGNLDGNDKTVTDLFINRTTQFVGLFGYVDTGASVSNLALVDVDITSTDGNVGGLAGFAESGAVEGVSVSGTVEGGNDVGGLAGGFGIGSITDSSSTVTVTGVDRVGGLAGYVQSASITGSHATGNVTSTGTGYVGGLVGENYGTIENSYATGNVSGDPSNGFEIGGLVGYTDGNITASYATGNVSGGTYVAGLVGEIDDNATITDSYATGDVNGDDRVGGLIGDIEGDIVRSYSIGLVTGNTLVGGLLGINNGTGDVTDSFWNTETSGQATSAGGTGKTTAQMKTLATFSDATWDIVVTNEHNLNNGYPFLTWQAGDSTPIWYIYEAPASTSNNTTTFIDPLTGKQVTLEVDPACDIQSKSITAESAQSAQDPGFDYPVGLLDFTLDCGTPGYTTTVTQYYYGISNDSFVLRKHNPNTHAYFAIAGFTLEQTTFSGQAALRVTYQATDGGDLDTDGTANGTIVDPVGLAQSVVGAPNTGLGGRLR
jgi:hypothetical protein